MSTLSYRIALQGRGVRFALLVDSPPYHPLHDKANHATNKPYVSPSSNKSVHSLHRFFFSYYKNRGKGAYGPVEQHRKSRSDPTHLGLNESTTKEARRHNGEKQSSQLVVLGKLDS